MKFSFSRRPGIALLPIVLALSLAMLMITLGMASVSFAETDAGGLIESSSRAFFAAEAGVTDALRRIGKDPSFVLSQYILELPATSAEVTVQREVRDVGIARIISTGSSGETTRRLEVSVQVGLYGKVTPISWHEAP